MSAEGLSRLEQVVQDGSKIQAQAASDSFPGEAKITEPLERARRRVREMGEPDAEAEPSRVEPAQRRARRERQQRLERGLEERQKLRPRKPRARVSVSEPEARRLRRDSGFDFDLKERGLRTQQRPGFEGRDGWGRASGCFVALTTCC